MVAGGRRREGAWWVVAEGRPCGWWVVAGGSTWGPLVTRGEDDPERVPLGGGWRGPSGGG